MGVHDHPARGVMAQALDGRTGGRRDDPVPGIKPGDDVPSLFGVGDVYRAASRNDRTWVCGEPPAGLRGAARFSREAAFRPAGQETRRTEREGDGPLQRGAPEQRYAPGNDQRGERDAGDDRPRRLVVSGAEEKEGAGHAPDRDRGQGIESPPAPQAGDQTQSRREKERWPSELPERAEVKIWEGEGKGRSGTGVNELSAQQSGQVREPDGSRRTKQQVGPHDGHGGNQAQEPQASDRRNRRQIVMPVPPR